MPVDLKDWLDKLKEMGLRKAILFPSKGEGPSSTKWVYTRNAMVGWAVLVALVASYCWVYVKWHIADTSFSTVIISIAGIALVTATVAHVKQNSQALKAAKGDDDAPKVDN